MGRHNPDGVDDRGGRTSRAAGIASALTRRVADAIRAAAIVSLAIGVVFAVACSVVLATWPPVRSGGGSWLAAWSIPLVGPAFFWSARRQVLGLDALTDRIVELAQQSEQPRIGRLRLVVALARDARGAPAGLSTIPSKLGVGLAVTTLIAAVTPIIVLGALVAVIV